VGAEAQRHGQHRPVQRIAVIGAMKRICVVRSRIVPDASCRRTAVTSIEPQPSGCGAVKFRIIRRSRSHVESALRQAFQYRWNCSSEVGLALMLRQRIVSRPWIVRAA
jgi:hypothetical protein